MPNKTFKLDYLKLGFIALLAWTLILGAAFYVNLGPYTPPPQEEMRTPEIVDAMRPTFAFHCYKGDESKTGSDLECENKLLEERNLMIFYMEKVRLLLFVYFTVPLGLWIFVMAFPRSFDFVRRMVDE